MNSGNSLKILMWFFGFFVYVLFICIQAVKLGKTPKSRNKRLRIREITFLLSIYLPPIIFLIYFHVGNKVSFADFFYFLAVQLSLVIGYSYFINRPRLEKMTSQTEVLFKSLEQINAEARFSFNPNIVQTILNSDYPAYVDGSLYDLRIDRVCKNEYGEYFWVQGSVRNYFEPSVKYLNEHGAKNLLREHRDIYLQEFNEEPYYTSQ